MHVAVIEPEGGIRSVLRLFLQEEGHTATGYREIPITYNSIDVVIFGPTFALEEREREKLKGLHISYIQLAHFEDMDEVMKRVASFARTEQRIVEDRAM